VLHCCRFRLLGFFLCRPVSTCRPWVCLDSYRSTPSSNTASHPSLSHVRVCVCAHASTISILSLTRTWHPPSDSNRHWISCFYSPPHFTRFTQTAPSLPSDCSTLFWSLRQSDWSSWHHWAMWLPSAADSTLCGIVWCVTLCVCILDTRACATWPHAYTW
jgi:hypothetical protein